MIKVLLINPSKLSNIGFDAIPSYPLGLLYLAAVLQRAGHRVKIIDFYLYDIQYSDINIVISKYKPDLIGLTAVSRFYNEMKRICKAITANVPIVLGGVHPSSLPEVTLRENNAEFLIIGEGEMTILELVDYIEKGGDLTKINGLAYKENGKIIINPPRAPIKNLDDLPFPAWDLLRLESYNTAFKSGYKGFFDYTEFMPIITSRGCPFRCTFCASTFFWGSSIRFRSIRNIIKEIEYDISHYNVKNFEIWDDNFTINRKRVIEFCKEIIKRKISASFYLVNGIRLDTLTRPLIKLMKLAGFRGVAISPESGSQEILNNVNKHLDLSIVKKVATMLHK
ncbi:MAG: B12-binding domain-containing radical SAM protein, partial [Promethearchaeota archaeon]